MYIGRETVDTPGAALLAQLTITGHREHGATMYGKLRAMGSLGWGISTLLTGSLISLSVSLFAGSRYTLLLLVSAIANALILPLLRSLPQRTSTTNSRLDKPPKRLPAFWLLMASNFLLYIGMNTMNVFMFVYIQDDLGANDATFGILAACFGLFEIPWMIWIHRVYGRMSTRTALLIGNAGLAMFMLSLALLTGTTLLFPLIAARGLFYALQNISQTVIVNEISHPANVATNQAINWVTMPALAAILTGPVAGWLYENSDPRLVWALSAFVMLTGGLLLVAGRGMIDRARAQRLPLHVD
jgi:predicted MFS family arabinose efflux permease